MLYGQNPAISVSQSRPPSQRPRNKEIFAVFNTILFTTGQMLAGEMRPKDLRRQLCRWTKSGRVMQLRRGVYMLNAAYAKRVAHPFSIANSLKKASYVSLQSALSHYGMIPEYVPVTTSVTTGRPEELSSPAGRFEFRHVATSLFWGFSEEAVAPEQDALLATPYKALLDLLYLTPRSDSKDYLRELRVTPPKSFSDAELMRIADVFGSAKVGRSVAMLIEMWREESAE